jgi:putative ribosome biogenesis GTPase RsgA
VVLPPGQIDSLLEQCKAYDAFRKYRVQHGLEELLPYGNGLVIMLCGKSGTGKTMTVNAIAKDMGKKVLLVDFGSLSGRKDGSDTDAGTYALLQ